MANETAEKTKAKELKPVNVELFPEWDGPRVFSDKRCGDGEHKFVISTPAPRNTEDCEKFYNRSLDTCIDAGYTQWLYNTRKADDWAKAKVKDEGEDPNDLADDMRTMLEEEVFIEAKERKTSKAKLLDQLSARLGVKIESEEDIAKILAEMEGK